MSRHLFVALCAVSCVGSASAWAQARDSGPASTGWPEYVFPLGSEISTLYVDDSQVEVEQFARWRPMCGTPLGAMSQEQLIQIAADHLAAFADGPAVTIDSGLRGGTINYVFDTDASVPAAALDALVVTEAYMETLFADPINVRVSIRFASLGGGVLGATGSNFVANVSFTNYRDGLQADMDFDDTLQSFLPAGATIPVRYNGGSDTVSSEDQIDLTRAHYRTCVGSVTGLAGSITLNSDFDWDYDPSNGVNFSRTSFIDVIVHEVGHAMGFVSAADNQAGGQMQGLDIFRFQRSDGCCNYNPDTEADFEITPRLVDFNTPDDDHNTDLIFVTYRMSDGNPWQASHFREQNPSIGTMDPALAGGETNHPNYFQASDLNVFDAIGYDYPQNEPPPPAALSVTQVAGTGVDLATADVRVQVEAADWWIVGGITSEAPELAPLAAGVEILFQTDPNTGDALLTNVGGGADPGNPATFVSLPREQFSVKRFGANGAAEVAGAYDPTGASGILNASAVNIGFLQFPPSPDGLDVPDDGYIARVTLDLAGSAYAGQTVQVSTGGAPAGLPVLLGEFKAASATHDVTAPLQEIVFGFYTSEPSDCPGDLDGSGAVDLSDLSVLLSNFGTVTGALPEDGDLDGDGDVDLTDLSTMLSLFGTTCP